MTQEEGDFVTIDPMHLLDSETYAYKYKIKIPYSFYSSKMFQDADVLLFVIIVFFLKKNFEDKAPLITIQSLKLVPHHFKAICIFL